jgi:hypothetical protein
MGRDEKAYGFTGARLVFLGSLSLPCAFFVLKGNTKFDFVMEFLAQSTQFNAA